MSKSEITIPLSVAVRLAKSDALETLHSVAEEAYRQGWENATKDVTAKAEGILKAISKGSNYDGESGLRHLLDLVTPTPPKNYEE